MYIFRKLKFRKINYFKKRSIKKRSSFTLPSTPYFWEFKESFLLFSKNITYLELNSIRYIFYKFRRCFVRKKYYLSFRIVPNFMFSKKSKNARMGKGTGVFQRPVRSIKTHLPLVVSSTFSKKRFLNLKLTILQKYPLWFF